MHRYDKGKEEAAHNVDRVAEHAKDTVPEQDRIWLTDVNAPHDQNFIVEEGAPHGAAAAPYQECHEAEVAIQAICEKESCNLGQKVEGIISQAVYCHYGE